MSCPYCCCWFATTRALERHTERCSAREVQEALVKRHNEECSALRQAYEKRLYELILAQPRATYDVEMAYFAEQLTTIQARIDQILVTNTYILNRLGGHVPELKVPSTSELDLFAESFLA